MSSDILRRPDKDLVTLSAAVENRFVELCDVHLRMRREALPIPDEMKKAMVVWRIMCVRHAKRDFRFTDSEKKATRELAQWTLDVNADLRNQPRQKLVWKD